MQKALVRSLRCMLIAALVVACGGTSRHAHRPDANGAEAAALDMQPPSGEAHRRLNRAVHAMDDGHVAEAIQILTELRASHRNNGVVLHELALAYRMQRQPAKAVEILSPFEDVLPADLLAGLGSALDEAGSPERAESVLRKGVSKFPASGLLHSELGTLLVNHGQPERAIAEYELGIKADPRAPSNYYNAAQLLAKGPRRGMSLVYGEIFRLLEPDSRRSKRTAELLVSLCRNAVRLQKQGDKTSAEISLAPGQVDPEKTPLGQVPFENALELTFGVGLVAAHSNGFSLRTLHAARSAFLRMVQSAEGPRSLAAHPLLRWLVALDAAGHLEAYDSWLYGPGFPEEFGAWLSGSEAAARLAAMAKYVVLHPLFPRAEAGSPDTI